MSLRNRLIIAFAMVISALPVCGQDVKPNPDSRGRSTAVALNYCRASFHRIRSIQSKRVLLEEQEKILNNLNLNGIGDEEVIKLYSAVLDEISQIDIAEREAIVLKDKYKKAVYRQLGSTAFVMAAQFATASIENMARTGVNSWLDYRDLKWVREFDSWKIEKSRIQAVVDKSSRFLDTFWKLAQKKNIPDRWLVRGNDLDNLSKAIQETDLDRRLRILKRMEPFMECYPPYWYYLARTQQGLGKLYDAAKTYDRLADLAAGHFRRDDMLAASMANRAIIQEYLQDDGAADSARESLKYSSAVWEANLMAAQVLERHNEITAAEDAILRNLDVELEVPRSATSLLGLYYRQDRPKKIAKLLGSAELLRQIPMISLIQAARKLPNARLPENVVARIQQTLGVAVDRNFGADDLLVISEPTWQTDQAAVSFTLPGSPMPATKADVQRLATGEVIHRYRGITDSGNPLRRKAVSLSGSIVTVSYEGFGGKGKTIRVVLGPPVRPNDPRATWWPAASPAAIEFEGSKFDLTRATLQIAQRTGQPERSSATDPGALDRIELPKPDAPPRKQTPVKAEDRNDNSIRDNRPRFNVASDRRDRANDQSPTGETKQRPQSHEESTTKLPLNKPSDVIPAVQPRAATIVGTRKVPRISILGVRAIIEFNSPQPEINPEQDRQVPPPPPE